MRLSELQYKDIINLEGRKIGSIIDVKIDRSGRIIALIIEEDKKSFRLRFSDNEIELGWDRIERIGDDVILVKL